MSEEKKIVLRRGLKTGDEEVDQYIEDLHNYLLSFETSNIKKLILSLDRMAGVLAEDVDMIIEGDDWESHPTEIESEDGDHVVTIDTGRSRLRILTDSKDSKSFERVMSLMQRIKDIHEVAKIAKSYVPTAEDYQEPGANAEQDLIKEVKLKGTGNVFEEMQEKHFSKREGRSIV